MVLASEPSIDVWTADPLLTRHALDAEAKTVRAARQDLERFIVNPQFVMCRLAFPSIGTRHGVLERFLGSFVIFLTSGDYVAEVAEYAARDLRDCAKKLSCL